MKIRYHFNTLPLLVLLVAATSADGQVQPQLAQRWFEEATKLCERDAGRLWGVSLCGPMVIADPVTGTGGAATPLSWWRGRPRHLGRLALVLLPLVYAREHGCR